MKINMKYFVTMIVSLFLCPAMFAFSCAICAIISFSSGGVSVSHNTLDEGMLYDTPDTEVAYNVQILRYHQNELDHYAVIYHSEPRKTVGAGYPGDSIKCGLQSVPFNYTLPSSVFCIWNHLTDVDSLLYGPEAYGLAGWGGAGNPMTVKGRSGDPYYYTFFIIVADDDRNRTGDDFRHYLGQARTTNFAQWQIRIDDHGVDTWSDFYLGAPDETIRPKVLHDTSGQPICSKLATSKGDTQGLIGSICYVNSVYYHFYTDRTASGETHLYYRTASNLSAVNAWSTETLCNSENLANGTVIRVAKAHLMDKWAILYNGYRLQNSQPVSDLMLQYTNDLALNFSSIQFFESLWAGTLGMDTHHALGLSLGSAKAQHFWLTDEFGNLTVPDAEAQDYTRGGLVIWTDLGSQVYGAKVYRAGWDVSGLTPVTLSHLQID
jgi:hypothetical protein